ncbi:MAG: hypothetical protein QOH60_2294 [Mycobacterium sp.]|jgi:hypothetical protein|nr:hypothetical protein [Mycobacterium sp.]
MSPRPRIAPVSLATAAALGFSVVISAAPPASADPCTGAAAAAQPTPAQNVQIPNPSKFRPYLPLGHMPAGANPQAPLPRLGQLPLAILKALTPQSAPVQKQAAVAPPPNPPRPQQPANAPPAAPPAQPDAAPPPDAIGPPATSIVGWVTGPDSPTNTIRRFAISGTDLGIMWDNGDPANNQVLIAFGDTSGYCNIPGQQWRYNALFRSSDRQLSQTINVADGVVNNKYSGSPVWRPGISKQIVNPINWTASETGIIPTAGIAVGRTQYLSFMSIRSWDNPGSWTTNFSAIAVSPDNGQNWGIYPGTIRPASQGAVPRVPFVAGNENFQQGAFLKGSDGFVYSYGTPTGRGGPAFVSRVPQNIVPDLTKYQYWNADRAAWVPGNPAAATPVIPGPVGEMSVQYNTYLKRFLTLYCNGANDVVARTAPAPQGPWGPETLVVPSGQIPGGIYAPFLHPWSTGKDVYFNLSLWSAYNVMLMHSVLP